MPHDKHGRPLLVGDRVLIEFEVTGVYPGENACNVSLRGDVVDGEISPLLTTNTKFCEKL